MINKWFDDQLEKGSDQKTISNLKNLKQALNFSDYWTESYNDGAEFILVPITKEFTSTHNQGKTKSMYLLETMDKTGDFSGVEILHFMPKGASLKLPMNTMQSIFNNTPVGVDGDFSFLTPSDRLIYQMSYEKGRLTSVGVAQKNLKYKPSPNVNPERAVIVCTQWYLVTTYYYANGTTYTTREYITENCVEEQGKLPPDDGGGAANNPAEEEEEVYERKAYFSFTAYYIPVANGGGKVNISNVAYGYFHKKDKTKDRITGCYLTNSEVLGNSQGLTNQVTQYTLIPVDNKNIKIPVQGRAKYTLDNYLTYSYTEPVYMGAFGSNNEQMIADVSTC